MTDTVIDVAGLRRGYVGGFEAVRGVSFSVARGEIFALLGRPKGDGGPPGRSLGEGPARPPPSSCWRGWPRRAAGRSASSGSTRTRGGPRSARAPGSCSRRAVSPRTSRSPRPYGCGAGVTTGARPAAEVLELVGLGARASVRVKQLSGGERRRLDLALALVGRPEVLFLDEPTTGMDPEGRRDTWALVRELRDRGTTVVLTTHYLEEAEELADRLAILHEGEIVLSGTPAEVTATRPARIRCTLPDGVPAARLPLSLHAAAYGQRVEIRTRRLQESLTELLRWAHDSGVELDRLEARSGSLEEAFLEIAQGRRTDDPTDTAEPVDPARAPAGAAR